MQQLQLGRLEPTSGRSSRIAVKAPNLASSDARSFRLGLLLIIIFHQTLAHFKLLLLLLATTSLHHLPQRISDNQRRLIGHLEQVCALIGLLRPAKDTDWKHQQLRPMLPLLPDRPQIKLKLITPVRLNAASFNQKRPTRSESISLLIHSRSFVATVKRPPINQVGVGSQVCVPLEQSAASFWAESLDKPDALSASLFRERHQRRHNNNNNNGNNNNNKLTLAACRVVIQIVQSGSQVWCEFAIGRQVYDYICIDWRGRKLSELHVRMPDSLLVLEVSKFASHLDRGVVVVVVEPSGRAKANLRPTLNNVDREEDNNDDNNFYNHQSDSLRDNGEHNNNNNNNWPRYYHYRCCHYSHYYHYRGGGQTRAQREVATSRASRVGPDKLITESGLERAARLSRPRPAGRMLLLALLLVLLVGGKWWSPSIMVGSAMQQSRQHSRQQSRLDFVGMEQIDDDDDRHARHNKSAKVQPARDKINNNNNNQHDEQSLEERIDERRLDELHQMGSSNFFTSQSDDKDFTRTPNEIERINWPPMRVETRNGPQQLAKSINGSRHWISARHLPAPTSASALKLVGHSHHGTENRSSHFGRLIDERASGSSPASASASGSALVRYRQQHQRQHQQLLDSNQNRQPGQAACPEQCVCVWKNGKKAADCADHQLSQIPHGFDPLLQVLNLSANYLAELPESAFVSRNLNNLQRIYLSR